MNMLELARIRNRKTGRFSSYDVTGRNADAWKIPAGKSRVLADIRGPGIITHIWMTQANHYRECLLRITWDGAKKPSVLCPLGDFFGLGHGMVNSYQSLLFTASTGNPYKFNTGCALNCYVPMPFRKRALVELVNESAEEHGQYFYVDYEMVPAADLKGLGCFHAEFRRTNPFGGWGHEITVNTPPANIVNTGRLAWDNNCVILETEGCGHYLGCNLSVTNFQGTWWGEGDDMIWVDGYKWPPDLHGTGSEDYLNQAWGMQPNAFMRNGSSIFEGNTLPEKGISLWGNVGGYQTSYIFHLENPVRFRKEIKVTIEHGHGNHLANEMSSTAYWYSDKPVGAAAPPPVTKRLPVLREKGRWVVDPARQCPGKPVRVTPEMQQMKMEWSVAGRLKKSGRVSPRHSRFITEWRLSKLLPPADVAKAGSAGLADRLGWRQYRASLDPTHPQAYMVDVHGVYGEEDGLVYLARRLKVKKPGEWILHVGHDGGVKVFIDGRPVLCEPRRQNPATYLRSKKLVRLAKGTHELAVALDTDHGMGWGFYFCFELPASARAEKKPVFPG